LIEPQSNAIEVGLGEAREIGSSREVLSQQAVGVLIAATLPWTARITEVNLHVGGNREAFDRMTGLFCCIENTSLHSRPCKILAAIGPTTDITEL